VSNAVDSTSILEALGCNLLQQVIQTVILHGLGCEVE